MRKTMSRSESMKGNKNGCKDRPRDGHIHCRFNKELLDRVKKRKGDKSLADYLEALIIADLG